MDIIESLQWRYAVKKFDPEKILTEDQINVLTESLRLTATSYGLQLMKFIVLKDKNLRAQLLDACYNQKQVEEASHLIVLCRNTNIHKEEIEAFIQNISETREIEKNTPGLQAYKKGMLSLLQWEDERAQNWMVNQIYIALGTLLTTCAVERIDACPMEGFIPSKIDKVLNLERQGLTSVLLCPVGYRSKVDKHSSYKKVRKSESDIILHWSGNQ